MGRSMGAAPVHSPPKLANPSPAAPAPPAPALAPQAPTAPPPSGAPPSVSSPSVKPTNGASPKESNSASASAPAPVALQNRPPLNSPAPSPAPAQYPRSMMGGMLGAVATGLGVSWLMHSFGWGSTDAGDSWLGATLILLLVFPFVLYFVRRLNFANPRDAFRLSPDYKNTTRFEALGSPNNPIQFTHYHSKNVGNDASARPWEGLGFEPSSQPSILQSNARSTHWRVPEDFDANGFVGTAKEVFLKLQMAWDCADMVTLHSMLTDQMLSEIKAQLQEREQHLNGQVNKTEVITLQAELLGLQELEAAYLASVEFSGLIREDPSQGPNSFREVWSMSKPRNGSSGWLVCGVQALQ